MWKEILHEFMAPAKHEVSIVFWHDYLFRRRYANVATQMFFCIRASVCNSL